MTDVYGKYFYADDTHSWYGGQSLVSSERSVKTRTVKRVRPADLFANGTPFVTNREYWSCTNMGCMVNSSISGSGPASAWLGWPIHLVGGVMDRSATEGMLRLRIKEEVANVLQNMAEYRQSCSMFGNIARDVYGAFRDLRRGSIRGTLRALKRPHDPFTKALANRWLEYQYGLKPLMNDYFAIVKSLEERINKPLIRWSSATVRSSDYKESWGSTGLYSPSTVLSNTTVVFSTRSRARYRISQGYSKDLASYGVTNPALLAWELIPYSFIVDMIIPVGDFLSSLDALTGIEDLVVVTSYHEEAHSNRGPCTYRSIYNQRLASSSSLAMPTLRIKPKTSLTPVLNGLALLRQLR